MAHRVVAEPEKVKQKRRKEVVKHKTSTMMNDGMACLRVRLFDAGRQQGWGHITARATSGVAHRRVLYDAEARRSQRDTVWANRFKVYEIKEVSHDYFRKV